MEKRFLENQNVRLVFGNSSDPSSRLVNSSLPRLYLNHQEASSQVNIGDILKIDFGGLSVQLIEQDSDNSWIANILSSGKVLQNRAVDVSNKRIDLKPLTDFDMYAIDFARARQFEEIYASFISSAKDVSYVRNTIPSSVKLISKIETALGVANASEIIECSDAVLIDRGDLSREISIPAIPIAVNSILNS